MVASPVHQYPSARRDESVVDFLHTSHSIVDPYRWLEDPDASETQAFVKAQNDLFQGYIAASPLRSKFKDRLTQLYDYERFGCPMQRGDAYYYFYNSGLQQQSVLYSMPSLEKRDQAVVFFDPNTLSADGTVSLNTYSFSEDGSLFAYALSNSGSDWVTIHVRKVGPNGSSTPIPGEVDPLEWAKFTRITWTKDGRGFFYNRYPKPTLVESASGDKAGTETESNRNACIYYHRLGTPQSEDILFFQDPAHPDYMGGATISDDGRYLFLTVSESCNPENLLFMLDLEAEYAGGPITRPPVSLTTVVDTFKAEYSYVANDGEDIYFSTTLNAPKRRIIKLYKGEFSDWIDEAEDVLESVVAIKDVLCLVYLKDVKNVAKLFSLSQGKPITPETLPLPEGAIISSLSGKREHTELFYSFSSFLTPGSIIRYDIAKHEHSVYRETKVKGLRSDELQVRQVFYPSKDGTKIPMYIISRKDTVLDGSNVTMLYGYGGFNISVTPSFAVTWLTFVQHMKGVVCVANIRGGGEYGEELWYKQGKLNKKQNVFDDFQWAAKWLIENKYTQPAKLAINGGSNGGLLVGACLNQAPELFGCAIAEVGVLDMLRFHKFTIGHAWTSDYGNPDVKEDFEVVLKYSPLHNVQSDKAYPATLILTGDHDDRVVPLHSLKFLATLQHVVGGKNTAPLMGRIETKAGHGAGKSTAQRIEEATDKFSFLGLVLRAEWSD